MARRNLISDEEAIETCRWLVESGEIEKLAREHDQSDVTQIGLTVSRKRSNYFRTAKSKLYKPGDKVRGKDGKLPYFFVTSVRWGGNGGFWILNPRTGKLQLSPNIRPWSLTPKQQRINELTFEIKRAESWISGDDDPGGYWTKLLHESQEELEKLTKGGGE